MRKLFLLVSLAAVVGVFADAGASSWLADRTAREVLGKRDATKLHTSLTLFAEAGNNEPVLRVVVDVWFRERFEEETMIRLDLVS